MEVRLIRNATLTVSLAGARLLVDPMFDAAGARPPVANTLPERANPLVELPEPPDALLAGVDAVLVTHLHADHFDTAAAAAIADRLPVYCQSEDVEALHELGVTRLTPIADEVAIGPLRVTRVGAQHGFGDLAEMLGPVSGYVIAGDGETLYVAGDTVWFDGVEATLARFAPDAVVVNAGGAAFVDSERIIMDLDDVGAVRACAPASTCVAVHLEAINHCPLTRAQLRSVDGVLAPEDGETLAL